MNLNLSLLSLVVAQHYRLLKDKVEDSKNKGGVQQLTDEEAILADTVGDLITGISGRKIGLYCRSHFTDGWSSLDMRSYKIKFVFTKLRDLLPEGAIKNELTDNLSKYVDLAEKMAGCTADAKRRSKKAKEEAIRKREEKKKLKEQEKLLKNDRNQMFFDGMDPVSMVIESPTEKIKSKVKKEKPAKKSKLDKLADEIIEKEYGREDEEDEDMGIDDEYSRELDFENRRSYDFSWGNNDD